MVNFVPPVFRNIAKTVKSVWISMMLLLCPFTPLYQAQAHRPLTIWGALAHPAGRHFVKKLSSLRAVADSTLPFATLSPSQKVSQSELFLFPVRARENPVYLQVTNRYAERRGVKPSYKAKCRQAPLAWRHGAVPWRPPARYLSYSQHLPTPALSLLSLSEPTFVVQRYLASLRQDLY